VFNHRRAFDNDSRRRCPTGERGDGRDGVKYRKKPVVIDAVQWTGANTDAVLWFVPVAVLGDRPETLLVPTLEGDHIARVGDWIIKGVQGEYYPCKPDIFEMSYEPVDEQAT
jgi:hypothetical protein